VEHPILIRVYGQTPMGVFVSVQTPCLLFSNPCFRRKPGRP